MASAMRIADSQFLYLSSKQQLIFSNHLEARILLGSVDDPKDDILFSMSSECKVRACPPARLPDKGLSEYNANTPTRFLLPTMDGLDEAKPPLEETRKKVRFAETVECAYFLHAQPPAAITFRAPIFHELSGSNFPELGISPWLANPKLLRIGAHCSLDSFRVENSEMELTGIIALDNIDFVKKVLVRFTWDHWDSFADCQAEYAGAVSALRVDKFSFRIEIPFPAQKTAQQLEFAICYEVAGQAFWDNYHNQNYRFDISSQVSRHPNTAADLSENPSPIGIQVPFCFKDL